MTSNTPRRSRTPQYRAAQALKDGARRLFGIGEIKTLVLARPGAYSGTQFPGITDEEQPRDGVLQQLRDPRLAAFILEEGSADDLMIIRYEAGPDDLRLLANTIGEIEKLLTNLRQALLNNEAVDEDIECEFNAFGASLQRIARQFCENMQAAGEVVAELNAERARRGWSPIHFEPVYSWSLLEQDRVPFGLLKSPIDNTAMPSWLHQDLTDPRFPRYFIEVDSIPEGHNIARWVWVELAQAQIAAHKAIEARHPELRIVPEWLVGLNRGAEQNRQFYSAVVNDAIDVKGDGHPGLIDGGVSGIDFIAAAVLALWRHYEAEIGHVAASQYAQFSGRSAQRVA